MTAPLKIRLLQYRYGVDAEAGALARIVPLGETAANPLTVVVPVGSSSETWKTVSVEPGDYLVEARLPSGGLAREHVAVTAKGSEVVLRGPVTRSENLAWQAAAVPHSRVFLESVMLGAGATRPVVTSFVIEDSGAAPWERLAELAVGSRPPTVAQLARVFGRTQLDPPHEPQVTLGALELHRWDFELGTKSLPNPAKRRMVVIERGDFVELLTLPTPWLVNDANHAAAVELAIPLDPTAPIGVTVQDPHFGSVIGYLAAGSTSDARTLLDHSEPSNDLLVAALHKKVQNPFAAAAGACVLVHTSSRAAQKWDGWLANLEKWFPWMSDGSVVHGLRQLRTGHIQQAWASFETAFARGIPVFAPCARDLFDAISMFVSSHNKMFVPSSKKRWIGSEQLAAMRTVMLCMQPDQAFTVLRFQGVPPLLSEEDETKREIAELLQQLEEPVRRAMTPRERVPKPRPVVVKPRRSPSGPPAVAGRRPGGKSGGATAVAARQPGRTGSKPASKGVVKAILKHAAKPAKKV
jgi:hypothetical protein